MARDSFDVLSKQGDPETTQEESCVFLRKGSATSRLQTFGRSRGLEIVSHRRELLAEGTTICASLSMKASSDRCNGATRAAILAMDEI